LIRNAVISIQTTEINIEKWYNSGAFPDNRNTAVTHGRWEKISTFTYYELHYFKSSSWTWFRIL